MNRFSRTLLVIVTLALTAGIVSAQDVVGDLLGRINTLRGTLGLPGYTLNGALSAAAQSQAQWMVDTGEVAHSRPDGSTPRSRAADAGYPTTEVSENIYGGGNATADDAWNFWINSDIHYRGLTNSRYQEIGIGAARGEWGAAFVLVFGNPGGAAYAPPAAAAGAQSAGGASGLPAYVVGLDAHGNIMHEVQPDDTLGDIALIYGYTWEAIPTMVALNGLTEADYRELEVGSIFLVPPQDGTYTPTPGDAAETPIPPAEATVESVTEPTATETPLPPQPTPTVLDIGIAGAVPDQLVVLQPTATVTITPVDAAATPSLTPLVVAAAGTPGVLDASAAGEPVIIRQSAQSPWLLAALVVQIGVLLAAAFEFIRRLRRKKR